MLQMQKIAVQQMANVSFPVIMDIMKMMVAPHALATMFPIAAEVFVTAPSSQMAPGLIVLMVFAPLLTVHRDIISTIIPVKRTAPQTAEHMEPLAMLR